MNAPATHRCKVCGALWWKGYVHPVGLSWSLRSPTCGKCCDNVAMGDQIEPLPAPPQAQDGGPTSALRASAPEGQDYRLDVLMAALVRELQGAWRAQIEAEKQGRHDWGRHFDRMQKRLATALGSVSLPVFTANPASEEAGPPSAASAASAPEGTTPDATSDREAATLSLVVQACMLWSGSRDTDAFYRWVARYLDEHRAPEGATMGEDTEMPNSMLRPFNPEYVFTSPDPRIADLQERVTDRDELITLHKAERDAAIARAEAAEKALAESRDRETALDEACDALTAKLAAAEAQAGLIRESWIAARQCIRELRMAIHYKEPWPKLWEILTEYDQRNHDAPAPGGSSGEEDHG